MAEGRRAPPDDGHGHGLDPDEAARLRQAARRARAAGLGFGVGFSYDKVPKAVAAAADRLRFPLFEVPYPVPFIAITEAVFTRIVAEQYDPPARRRGGARPDPGGHGGRGSRASPGRWPGRRRVGPAPGPSRHAHRDHRRGRRLPAGRVWRSCPPRRAGGTASRTWTRGTTSGSAGRGARPGRGVPGGGQAHGPTQSTGSSPGTHCHCSRSSSRRARGGRRGAAPGRRVLRRPGGGMLDPRRRIGAWPGSGSTGRRRCRSSPWRRSGRSPPGRSPGDGQPLSREGRGVPVGARHRGTPAIAARSGVPTRRMPRSTASRGRCGWARAPRSPRRPSASLREARYARRSASSRLVLAGFDDLGTYRLLLSMAEPDALRAFADSMLAPLMAYDPRPAGSSPRSRPS